MGDSRDGFTFNDDGTSRGAKKVKKKRFNPSEAAAKQIGGTHYNKKKIQPWDIIDEYGLDFYRGNIIKYVLRNKMDVYEDMLKAQHYLDKWLEVNKEINK